MRLILYKRISSAETAEELRELQVELIDRFGLLPEPARNLLRIAAIKQTAAGLGVEKIDVSDNGGYLIFAQQSHIDPVALVQLVQNDDRKYKLQGSHRLQFRGEFADLERRFSAVDKLLLQLTIEEPAARTG